MPHKFLTSAVLILVLSMVAWSTSVQPASASKGAEIEIGVVNNTSAIYMVVLVSNGGMSPERELKPGERMVFPREKTKSSKAKTEWKLVFNGEGLGATQCRAYIRPERGSYTVFKECVTSVVKIDYEVRDDGVIIFTLHE